MTGSKVRFLPYPPKKLMRIIVSLIGIAIGIFLVVKSPALVNALGDISFAEQYLGNGGTYTFYKLVGVVFIALATLYMLDLLHFSSLIPIPTAGP